MVDSRSYKEMRVQGGDRERGEGCCKWYIDGEHEKELEIRYQGVYERERDRQKWGGYGQKTQQGVSNIERVF